MSKAIKQEVLPTFKEAASRHEEIHGEGENADEAQAAHPKHIQPLTKLYPNKAALLTALKHVSKTVSSATTEMQLIGVSTLARLYDDEDITVVRNLFKYFPAGMKEKAMRAYVLSYFPVEYAKGEWHFNPDAKNRFSTVSPKIPKDERDRLKALQEKQLQLAMNQSWWNLNSFDNPIVAGETETLSDEAQGKAPVAFDEISLVNKLKKITDGMVKQFEAKFQAGPIPGVDIIHMDTMRKLEAIAKQLDAIEASLKVSLNPITDTPQEKAAA